MNAYLSLVFWETQIKSFLGSFWDSGRQTFPVVSLRTVNVMVKKAFPRLERQLIPGIKVTFGGTMAIPETHS